MGDQRWSLADIPWHRINPAQMAEKEDIFYMVATASFMEATTDQYTRNLIDFFRGDAEIVAWLEDHWLPEELQHGHALRRYVEIAWPDFDWERTYRSFVEEFTEFCAPDALEHSRCLELASRCVVEMGTASYYTTVQRVSPDPVLAALANCIYRDEVRHYKHFYGYFRRWKATEDIGRMRVAGALWRRLRMTGAEDSFIVLKHVYMARNPGQPYDSRTYLSLRRQCRDIAFRHFPHDLSLKMLLRPLDLNPQVHHVTAAFGEALARRLVP